MAFYFHKKVRIRWLGKPVFNWCFQCFVFLSKYPELKLDHSSQRKTLALALSDNLAIVLENMKSPLQLRLGSNSCCTWKEVSPTTV